MMKVMTLLVICSFYFINALFSVLVDCISHLDGEALAGALRRTVAAVRYRWAIRIFQEKVWPMNIAESAESNGSIGIGGMILSSTAVLGVQLLRICFC